MRRPAHLLLALTAAATLAACGGMRAMPGHTHGPAAVAELKPTAGNTAAGTVNLRMMDSHVMVMGEVRGLKPNQEHGFHIHEKGDCSAPDGSSAGGHYNPGGSAHGPQTAPHHAGDLPSLKADANGVAKLHFPIVGVAIGSGSADIVGRGLIVHAQPDDYATQPTGNSGARIACAVITRVP